MTREIIRPGKGVRIQPKISKRIPMAINSTPTSDKKTNAPGTPKVGPQENLTWNHEDYPEDTPPNLKISFVH